MEATQEDITRWQGKLEKQCKVDGSLAAFAAYNAEAALSVVALHEMIEDKADAKTVEAHVRKFGWKHMFKRDFPALITLAEESAATFGATNAPGKQDNAR